MKQMAAKYCGMLASCSIRHCSWSRQKASSCCAIAWPVRQSTRIRRDAPPLDCYLCFIRDRAFRRRDMAHSLQYMRVLAIPAKKARQNGRGRQPISKRRTCV
jgi:hypothetical protein